MADIIIGKAEVVGIERISLDDKTPGQQPNKYVDQLTGVMSPSIAPKKLTSMVVSRLKITSTERTKGYTTIEGIMTIPSQLQFGKVYELTLHDPSIGVLDTNNRVFREDEHALNQNTTIEV